MASNDWIKDVETLLIKIRDWITALSPYKKAGLIIGLGVGLLFHSALGGLLLGFGVAYLYEYLYLNKSGD